MPKQMHKRRKVKIKAYRKANQTANPVPVNAQFAYDGRVWVDSAGNPYGNDNELDLRLFPGTYALSATYNGVTIERPTIIPPGKGQVVVKITFHGA